MNIFKNLWLKLVALGAALLVWFHVETEKTYEYRLKLPVTRVDLREQLTLSSNPPESLEIAVAAKGKQLMRAAWREQGIRINASRLQTGHYSINLSGENCVLAGAGKNVTLTEVIEPSSIELEIDHESSVSVLVVPDLTAEPDDGFAVSGAIESDPERVVLSGPRSIIKNLTAIHTEPRSVTDLRNNVSLKVPLALPVGYGMKLRPDSVTLSVTVVPVRTRVFDNLPVAIFNVPVGYSAVTSPAAVRIELTGPPDEIELLNKNALAVSADYRQADRLGMAPVKVACPRNFKVKKASADSVRILATPDARTRH